MRKLAVATGTQSGTYPNYTNESNCENVTS